MKLLLAILMLIALKPVAAQNCKCDRDSVNLNINCDTILFDNHAMLYWNYNCDSSWLTFKNQDNKVVLFSLGAELMWYTGNIGYSHFIEYKSMFLGVYQTISGCCSPPDYYLHDKTSGKLIRYLGPAIFASADKNFPYVVSFANSPNLDSMDLDYNTLVIYNIETGKEAKMKIAKGDIKRAIESSSSLSFDDIFRKAEVIDGKIILKYISKLGSNKKGNRYKTITVDVNQYGI